jgi:hypothetical protein
MPFAGLWRVTESSLDARYSAAGKSSNESWESSGALRAYGRAGELVRRQLPPFGLSDKTFHVMDRGAEEYSVS